jgi:hypothetical protein
MGLGAQADAALLNALKGLLAREEALKKSATKANIAAVRALIDRVLSDESTVNRENSQALSSATGKMITQVPSQVASAKSDQNAANVCEAQASQLIFGGTMVGGAASLGVGASHFAKAALKWLAEDAGEEVAGETAPETEGLSVLFYGAALIIVTQFVGVSYAATC